MPAPDPRHRTAVLAAAAVAMVMVTVGCGGNDTLAQRLDGVAELEAGYADITVSYTQRTDGAQLTYETDDPELVNAIHSWFDRQVMDHGAHAETRSATRFSDR